MAKKYGTNIDLNQNQLLKARIENYPGNPNGSITGVEGQILFDTMSDKLWICTGGDVWILPSAEVIDTNTTYEISAESTIGGAVLRLLGSDASVDEVMFSQGSGITISRDASNVITVSAIAYVHPTFTPRAIDTSNIEVLDILTVDANGHVTNAAKRVLPDATPTTPGIMTAADKAKLNTVAEGAEANVNPDWNSTTGKSQILNKPTLGTAAGLNTGTGSGQVPILNSSGKLADSVIPNIAITQSYPVNSEVEMLALSNAQVGDVAIRSDISKTFILKSEPSSTLSNWLEMRTPTDVVQSVNGQTGAVILDASDVGAEPSIGAKGTAFNKNFGTASGTVLEGSFSNTIEGKTDKYATTLATSATSYVITHNLNTQDAVAIVREVSSPYAEVITDVEYTSLNTITIRFAIAPAAGAYRVVVVG